MEFKKFDKNEMIEELQNDTYNLVYINYEKENGIKAFKNTGNALSQLSEKEDLNEFYKIYIFNETFMKTIYKFGENDFRYVEVKEENLSNIKEREILVDFENFNRLKVKIGEINGKEVVKFVEFLGGENDGTK